MKHKIIVIAGISAVVLAGTGTALAATGTIPDSSGVIHGCYSAKGGALSVIDSDAGQACAKGTTALNWNRQGPQGPAGPQGPSGLAGVDRGYATYSIDSSGDAHCTLSNLTGPDTANLTTSGPAGCQIFGLPQGPSSIMLVTPSCLPGVAGCIRLPQPSFADVEDVGAGTGWVIHSGNSNNYPFTVMFVLFP